MAPVIRIQICSSRCTVADNAGDGVILGTHSLFEGNHLADQGGAGLVLDFVYEIVVRDNSFDGISAIRFGSVPFPPHHVIIDNVF